MNKQKVIDFVEMLEKETRYCRTCKHRKHFQLNEYSNKVVQCCDLQRSHKSNSGYKTIKDTNIACGFYEPKFKVGDWVVFPLGIIGRIDTLDDVNYHVTTTDGYNFDYKILKQHFYHLYLWSINDAKDGDVLYSLDSNQPFIYKERPQFSQARGYCCINKFGEFAVWNTSKCVICTDKYIPATKEQRELLFQKMKKAGYEWNSEKKELKKIEPKMLDADEVIEWVKTKVYDDSTYGMAMIDQFKKDFGL